MSQWRYEYGKASAALQQIRSKVIPIGNVSGTDKYISHTRGTTITDVESNEYIDFAGGIAVMNVGLALSRFLILLPELYVKRLFLVNGTA